MSRVLIIAEAGVNHNGDMDLAKRLVDVAVEADADVIKFQSFKATRLVSKKAMKAAYQLDTFNDGDLTQFGMLKSLELTITQANELNNYCKLKGIVFNSTPFDEESALELETLNLPFYKIPSGEITNLPLLNVISSLGRPVILSTGMANLQEIKNAVAILKKGIDIEKITVLHCNTEYPTPFEDVNLLAMATIRDEIGVEIGYSDHTLGIEIPIAAVALGAKVIEKHFTLAREMPGPDHKASLEPEELKLMIKSIRNIEKSLGTGIKEPSLSESRNKDIARKSIHFAKDLKKGDTISESDLIALRPGDGVSPMSWHSIVGKVLVVNVSKDQKLNVDYIK